MRRCVQADGERYGQAQPYPGLGRAFQKAPELLSKMMIAVANACMAEKGALKSMLKRFSSTLPIRKQTSLSLA